ncbi:hypothetical protein M8C21_023079 [Ambrosia artemisiifolia]|uniref:Uncharacterized protein n=1 Tax=Ambrosia artemisiifolia TaxID=4212 RepID=A0AAD5G6I4_AMBAR|nr:hypothetical protein M8C21_023079 [Ambrosia artemisiifolia]
MLWAHLIAMEQRYQKPERGEFLISNFDVKQACVATRCIRIECRHSFLYRHSQITINRTQITRQQDLVEHVKKMFTKLSANPLTTTELVEKEHAIFTGSEIRMRDDDAPLDQFAVAFLVRAISREMGDISVT